MTRVTHLSALIALAVLSALGLTPNARAQSGHALSFHPYRGSEVNVPLETPAGAFTLEAWVRAYSDPETYGYFTIMEFGDDKPFFGIIGNALGVDGVVRADYALPTGTWQHVAYTFDGTTSRLYLNGVEIASAVATPARGGALGIGHGIGDTAWMGDIDEAIVWNRARTAAEIRADMDGLSAAEATDAALRAYFKFDEGTGQTVANQKPGGPNGTLGPSTAPEINDPVWITLTSTGTHDTPRAGSGLRITDVWPNPARTGATVELDVAAVGTATVAVFDALGRLAVTLHEGAVATGNLRLAVPALTPGVYVIRATGEGAVATRTLTVTR